MLKLCKKQLLIQLMELRRVKAPCWKCATVKVNFFQEMSSHGVVSDMCDIRNKKLFFFQNLTQQVIRLCDTSTMCVENRPFFSFPVSHRSHSEFRTVKLPFPTYFLKSICWNGQDSRMHSSKMTSSFNSTLMVILCFTFIILVLSHWWLVSVLYV